MGYVPYENEINHLGYSKLKIKAIKQHLRNADLVVANSHFQANFIVSQQPELRGKTFWSAAWSGFFQIH